MSQIGWVAGILGAAAGIGVGNQFHPLPHGWHGFKSKQDRMNFAKTAAVSAVFGSLGAAVGYFLTGCDCCPSVGGLGTPLQVPVMTPTNPPATDSNLPPGTPK